MAGRRGTIVVRRSAAVTAAVALCGWMSTLAPASPATLTEDAARGTPVAGPRGGAVGTRTGPTATPSPTRSAPPPRPSSAPRPASPPRPAAVDCAKAKCVALTFDDGPMGSTARLLDILAARNVKVTFFLVGRNAEEYPHLVRREAAEGHELANHSYTHADLGRSSAAKVTSELLRTQRAIQRAAGVTPKLMRPPYGSTDREVARVTRRLGLAQVLWTVDPLDWQSRNSGKVERKVVRGTRRGTIVLLHDIHSSTVAAVPRIIDRLAAKGYVFVTISQLYGEPLTPGKKYTEGPIPAPNPSATAGPSATAASSPSAGPSPVEP